ncbi:MAG TPA: DNA-processing protein DprA [Flavobacteriales bacterium]|jgi:predicted Rossmann fold nucleotide-binding protein DprA/Smf involved in DNA uptake|nr:DNA-processing protein DprA [Flavobacteriales bacterium]
MNYDKNTQAIILLSCHFSKAKKDDPNPLTPTEFGRFSLWLFKNKYQPSDLFDKFETVGSKWNDPKNKITTDRLKYLLGRGLAMSLALEKWESAGIWVIIRKSPQYPKKLKEHLKENAPALLFGVGNKELLNSGGLAIVGSRSINDVDNKFTQEIAKKMALDGFNIISGGARGVDETSMLSALDAEGNAIGVLSNGLLSAAVSGKWRKYIKNNQLLLISIFYPDAGFNVGNAMARNKYIYCMSDAALVVHSGTKGGTWTGALENLKKEYSLLWVKKTNDVEAGNKKIVEQGGCWYEESMDSSSFFARPKIESQKKSEEKKQSSSQMNLF